MQEQIEDFLFQIDELANLRHIAEANFEEALRSLEAEREQKHALRKELDKRISNESVFNLSNLAHLNGLANGLNLPAFSGNESSVDTTIPLEQELMPDFVHHALKRIEANFSFGNVNGKNLSMPRSGVVSDILSEIQVQITFYLISCRCVW